MNEAFKCAVIAGVYMCSIIEQLHPGAAMGASFGCFCFLAFADPTRGAWLEKMVRKTLLLIGSWGIGYSFGSAVATSANWSGYAMLAAVAGAALGATIFGALNLMVRNDGPLPQWLSAIVDRIPVLRKGNDGNP